VPTVCPYAIPFLAPTKLLSFVGLAVTYTGAISWLVDFDLFLHVLNRPDGFRAPGQPEDFVRGFQVFDKDGTGVIGVGELKYGIK